MSQTATVRVMSPEEIAAQPSGDAPLLILPERSTVFAERAMRLRQLARGHAMGDFLAFMADLAMAQHELLRRHGEGHAVALPSADAIDRAARMGVPPIPAVDWPRDAAWREALRGLARALHAKAPPPTRKVLASLREADDDTLERQADTLLHGLVQGLDLAAAPLVGAALQVHFTHLVLATQAAHQAKGGPFGRIDDSAVCPCCGSQPVAGLIRASVPGHAQLSGQRYLQCSLCGTQWHRLRIECTHCGSSKAIAYESLQAADADDDGGAVGAAVVQAETCGDCGHYLKLLHGDRDPMADAVADDLASVTLDLLVSESGRRRHGVNLMLLFGDPGAASPGDPTGDPGGGAG